MQSLYSFQTDQFGIDTTSLYLLRNGFNYKTLPQNTVSYIVIKKGMDLKNWWWVLIVGLALTFYGLYDIATLTRIFQSDSAGPIRWPRLLIPVFPLLLGLYSVVISVRRTKVMLIKSADKIYRLSLREIIKAGKFNDFITYLQSNYGSVKNSDFSITSQ